MKRWDKGSELRITERFFASVCLCVCVCVCVFFAVIHCNFQGVIITPLVGLI